MIFQKPLVFSKIDFSLSSDIENSVADDLINIWRILPKIFFMSPKLSSLLFGSFRFWHKWGLQNNSYVWKEWNLISMSPLRTLFVLPKQIFSFQTATIHNTLNLTETRRNLINYNKTISSGSYFLWIKSLTFPSGKSLRKGSS